mgnify:FL=1
MAVAFTSEPVDDLNLTNQHNIFAMYDSAEVPDRYIVQVYENNYFSGDGTLIAKIYLTPNENDRGVFDLGDLVNNRLSPPVRLQYQTTNRFVMTGYSSVEKATTTDMVARKYTLKAGRIKDGTETLGQDTAIKYLCGGAWQLKDGKHPSFSDYYLDALSNTAKGWLTNLPNNSQVIERYMADDDEGRVGLVSVSLMGVTNYLNKATIEAFEADGTSIHSETLSSLGFGLYHNQSFHWVPCGPANVKGLFGADWSDDWDYIEIIPRSSGNTQIGAKYVVRRDCRPIKHEPVQLAWTNTVGGWDSLRFDARAPKTIQKKEKRFRKDPLTWQDNAPSWYTWDRQNTTFHNEGRIRFTLTHDQFNADERALLEYCMRSRLVYYRYGTEDWLPCVVDTNSLVIEPAGSKMYRVSLVIEDANPVRC